ncbi:DEAD/DEAH box helicase family protein [Enterobacter hormaechei]|nr:DEAD/DEAH box helicase family protein [Enterobacter hormaechei]EKM7551626.1 DEAD/DEAH box helicase family protein [Enterobacter hormaechei]EKV5294922.1 DEAD/DEAH box helicase family protein [Enterobacter hormaechei]EKW8463319.1 DEAD/DEAH box helicase family protein [Enterobacter hormaechei]
MYNYLSKEKFKYVSGDCGSGKTYALTQLILRSNDKFLIAQGTLNLTKQTAKDLGNIAKLITMDTSKNVQEDIIDFLLRPTHRVLIITDIAFLQIRDTSLLKNWQIYLDDVVNFHNFVTKNTELKEQVEKNLFHSFEAIEGKHVTAKPQTEFDDDLLSALAKEFTFVKQYDYFLMNAGFFEKVGATNTYKEKKGQLQVMSWVNLNRYAGLDVTFMANDFEKSLIYLASPNKFIKTDLQLRQRKTPLDQRMRVHYFSDVTLTGDFQKYSPEQFYKAVEWVNTNLNDYIFTVNGSQSTKVLNGTYVPPKSRGINEYKDFNKAVWFVSLKPSSVEVKQCELMFDLTYEQILHARQNEEMYQFIQRTQLRDFDSEEVVDVYVFDKEQALYLSDDPIYIDLGIELSNSTKPVSTFVAMNLTSGENSAYGRITIERFPTQQSFDKWMNKKAQLALSPEKKEYFENKYKSLQILSK